MERPHVVAVSIVQGPFSVVPAKTLTIRFATLLHRVNVCSQPFDPEITMNDLKSPADVVDFEALAEWTSGSCTSQVTRLGAPG